MVFNCAKLRNVLTHEYLNNATPQELHQFEWLDEDQIAEIPVEYNHLVGYYKPQQIELFLKMIKQGDYQVFTKPEDFENYQKNFRPRFRG